MPTASSRATILRELCARLHAAEGFLSVGVTTALGTSTTAIDGVRLAYADADADALGNPILRIDELVGAGPAAGEFSQVRDGGLTPATGSVLLSPALSAPVQSGTDYSLWKVIHPRTAEDILNRVLRNMRREAIIPVSLLVNPDFEVDTADWTPTTATLTRVTTVARVAHGEASMRIEGTGAAPQADSGSVRVVEGDQYIVAARGMTDVGTLTLAARNVTGATDIATASHEEEAYLEMIAGGGLVSIPSGCEELAVRFRGTADPDDFYVDDVVVWPAQRNWFTLPSFVEDPNDLLSVGYFRHGRSLSGSNAFMVDEGEWIRWPYTMKPNYVEEGGARPFQLELQTPITWPLFARVMRPYAELATDTATTTADRELVVGLTLREVFRHLQETAARAKDTEAQRSWAAEAERVGAAAVVRAFDSRHSEQTLTVITPRRRRSGGW